MVDDNLAGWAKRLAAVDRLRLTPDVARLAIDNRGRQTVSDWVADGLLAGCPKLLIFTHVEGLTPTHWHLVIRLLESVPMCETQRKLLFLCGQTPAYFSTRCPLLYRRLKARLDHR